jgi:hypothetical protein
LHIGNNDKEYKGFRKMTKVDITDDFKKIFIRHANFKVNICALDNNMRKVILIDNCYLLADESKFYISKYENCMEIYVGESVIYNNNSTYCYKKCNNIQKIETSEIYREDKFCDVYMTFFIPIV